MTTRGGTLTGDGMLGTLVKGQRGTGRRASELAVHDANLLNIGRLFMDLGCFEPYVWRPPERATPERQAEWAEWDRQDPREHAWCERARAERAEAERWARMWHPPVRMSRERIRELWNWPARSLRRARR
jgi:hypothetical protein